MEQYYITGASGYLGLQLTDLLKKKNICHKGFSRNKKNKNFTFVKNYREIPFKSNTIIIHLAQSSFIKEVNKVNDDNEINILNGLLDKNWTHFVFASSAYLYGEKNLKRRKESDKIDVSNLYSSNKHKCEKMVIKKGGTVLRFTNIYGLKPKKNTVLDNIFKSIARKDKTKIENISIYRDFLWIDDAIESILRSCKYKPNKILNIGTGKATSIKEIYELIYKLTKSDPKNIKFKKEGKKSCIVVNTDEAKKHLKWLSKTNIENGLKKIIANLEI